jgi:Tol biopolymer transport system component
MSRHPDRKNPMRQWLHLIMIATVFSGLLVVTSDSKTRARSIATTRRGTNLITQPPITLLKANGKIAFVSRRDGNREIYEMNADGTNQTRVTNRTPFGISDPAWSPDGLKIAFASNRDGTEKIYVMDADGSSEVRITNSQADDSQPAWSADGERIAFTRISDLNAEIANAEIYEMNADGTNQTKVTNSPAFDSEPAWSPDGSKIAFTSNRDGSEEIYVMNADGNDVIRLTHDSGDVFLVNGVNSRAPSWSPDGSRIVFDRVAYGGICDIFECEPDIYVMNADGNGQMRLDYGGSPAWSPDGNKIAFEHPGGIRVMNADGTNNTLLTIPGVDSEPAWQPLTVVLPTPNLIDDPAFFVRQHYRDFLGREADAPGEAHWTGEITMCSDAVNRLSGESEAQCIDRKRANTSGAFYLSNEFQNSANFLIRVNWGSLGQDRAAGRKCIVGQHSALDALCRPLYSDYVSDLAKLTQGIVVNDALDPNAINLNKHNFVNEFVTRPDFLAAYPNTMTAEQYIDKLSQTTGVALTAQERSDLITKVGSDGRAAVLYDIVDGTTAVDGGLLRFDTRYGKAYYDQEFNPAFVFAEYLAYLRRNPDQAGYDHWLGKLNFYGNFVDAEMVRAFIVSHEYRGRFGS